MAVNNVVFAKTLFSSRERDARGTIPPKYAPLEFFLYGCPGVGVVGSRNYPKYYVGVANPSEALGIRG